MDELLFDTRVSEKVSLPVICWGAGGVTANLWWESIVTSGYNIQYFVDKYKYGLKFHEKDIISPMELFSSLGNINSFLYVVFTVDPLKFIRIKNEISSYGVIESNIISCANAFYLKNKDAIMNLYERLADDDSRSHFEAFLRCRMYGELIPEQRMIRNMQYFSIYEFQKIDNQEVYVDAGAFVGDTLEKFLFEKFGTFKKYYAFEPYSQNFMALQERVKRLAMEWGMKQEKIVIEQKALDITNRMAVINDSLHAIGVVIEDSRNESVNRKTDFIETCRIDDYFADIEYSTLKADIEGKELDMLQGGISTIRKYGAKLAISVYHLPNDIFVIPKLIMEINSSYHLKFRCHMQDGADSILYACL